MAVQRIAVRVDQRQAAAISRTLRQLRAPQLRAPVRRFLLKAGYAVLKDAAENQIIRGGRVRGPSGPRGGRGKRTDTPPHPSRLTSRTGELRQSLGANRGTDRSGLPRYVDVGSDLDYAPIHELGLGPYPKRPFLAPAAEAVSPQFPQMLLAELEAALAKVPR